MSERRILTDAEVEDVRARLRWPTGKNCPYCDDLLATLDAANARAVEAVPVLAWILRLPGAIEPTIRQQAEFGEWCRIERIWLTALDAEAKADEEREGPLRCYRLAEEVSS